MSYTHSLLIDTTLYSGNFERDLCAWLTGQTGECGVGEDVASRALPTLRHAAWWDAHIVQTADDNGCHRPVAIAPTPGFFNNGYGGHYPDTPEGHAAALPGCREGIEDRFKRDNAMLDRVVLGQGGWNETNLAEARARSVSTRDEALAIPEVQKFPAYQSVEIFLDAEAPEEVLEEVRARLKRVVQDPYGTGVFRSYGPTHQPAAGFEVIGLRASTQPEPEAAKVRSLAL